MPRSAFTISNTNIAKLVLHVRDSRRLRAKYFDPQIFGEPAWDIMLSLYEAVLAQRFVTVSELCAGAGVPPTTALRWLHALERRGLVLRRDDPTDGRRVFVYLSQAAITAMDVLFESFEIRTAALQFGRRID